MQRATTYYPVDTIEWCPSPYLEEYFLEGTYYLKPEAREAPQTRIGRLAVNRFNFRTNEINAVTYQDTAAILDSRWHNFCNYTYVVTADAVGSVGLFHFTDFNLVQQSKVDLHTDQSKDSVLLVLSVDTCTTGNCHSSIIASDSQGGINLMDIGNDGIQVITRWRAHNFEAWTCTFDKWNPNVIYSGGDDTTVNVYDVREAGKACKIETNNCSMAGVTSLLSFPNKEYTMAIGGYDEELRIYDTRQLKRGKTKTNLSGGIWRIKQNQFIPNLLLTSCMYNYFKIINMDFETDNTTIASVFREHGDDTTICYAADWANMTHETDLFMATGSFYNKKLIVSRINYRVEDTMDTGDS